MSGTGGAYAAAGVDIEKAAEIKRRIAEMVAETRHEGATANIGHFGGLFSIPPGHMPVSTIDGVGTKTIIALSMKGEARKTALRNLGRDIVHHCVNDLLCTGATPWTMLDYFGCHTLSNDDLLLLMEGMCDAARKNDVAIIGGETAQMNVVYAPGQFDLVGAMTGIVRPSDIIDGSRIRPGDKLIGVPSVGPHTNGYSLIRTIFDAAEWKWWNVPGDPVWAERFQGLTLGEIVLEPHRSYLPLKQKLDAWQKGTRSTRRPLKGIAHITGGGLDENITRLLPEGCRAVAWRNSWTVLPAFQMIQAVGKISEDEMHRVFNMGVGLVLIVAASADKDISAMVRKMYGASFAIGEIREGVRGFEIVTRLGAK